MTMTLRARCTAGGSGRVQWKTADQDDFPAAGQTVEYALSAREDCQEITVDLPVEGKTSIVRLYLPARSAAVEIESIEFRPLGSDKPVRAWSFRSQEE